MPGTPRKSALKTNGSNKTKKRVEINPIPSYSDKDPDPITPRTRAELWSTTADEKNNRLKLRKKKEDFERARRNAPAIAARVARGRFKTGSPPSPPREGDINIPRTTNSRRINPVVRPQIHHQLAAPRPEGGPIARSVRSFLSIFRRRGGKATRKNRRK